MKKTKFAKEQIAFVLKQAELFQILSSYMAKV